MATRAQCLARAGLSFVVSLALLPGSGCIQPPNRDEQGEAQAGGEAEAAPATAKREASIPAEGWNDAIAWRGLDEGLQEAKRTGMPLMMVIHTDWCGNCQKLKVTFNQDDQLARLSEHFVMVHVNQDRQPEATLYGPDGQYIPRVLFLDSDGNVDSSLQNPNRPSRFRYFYTPQEDLVSSMREALERHGNKS